MSLDHCSIGPQNSLGSREVRGLLGNRVGEIDFLGTIRDDLGREVGRLNSRDLFTRGVNIELPLGTLSGPAARHLNIR